SVGLSPLVVLVAVTTTGLVLGGVAVILAVPLASILVTLIDIVVRDKDPPQEPAPSRLFPAKEIAASTRYAASAASAWAASHRCPSGSAKHAVRNPHGRSSGPLTSSTPCSARRAHAASASSTQIVSWERAPAAPSATPAGSISPSAAECASRLTR